MRVIFQKYQLGGFLLLIPLLSNGQAYTYTHYTLEEVNVNQESQRLMDEFMKEVNSNGDLTNLCVDVGFLVNEGPAELSQVPGIMKDSYGAKIDLHDFNFFTFDDIEKDNELKAIAVSTVFFDNRQILGVGQCNGQEVVVIIVYEERQLKLLGLFRKNEPILTFFHQNSVEPNQYLDSLNLKITIPPHFEGPSYYGDKNGMISYTVGSDLPIRSQRGYINYHAGEDAELFINSFQFDTTYYTTLPKTTLEGTVRWIGVMEASEKGRVTDVTMKFTPYGCFINYNLTIRGVLYYCATSGLRIDGYDIFVTIIGTEHYYESNASDYFLISESLNANRTDE